MRNIRTVFKRAIADGSDFRTIYQPEGWAIFECVVRDFCHCIRKNNTFDISFISKSIRADSSDLDIVVKCGTRLCVAVNRIKIRNDDQAVRTIIVFYNTCSLIDDQPFRIGSFILYIILNIDRNRKWNNAILVIIIAWGCIRIILKFITLIIQSILNLPLIWVG